jgi:hypothetical protein
MSRYGAGVTNRAGINTADSVYFQLRPTSTSQRIKVLQIVIAVLTAPSNAPQPYLTRSSAIGTNTATIAGLPYDSGDAASIVTLDSTWSAAPTITAANKIAVGAMGVTAGGGWIWDFRDMPLVMQASTTAGLCVVNAAASGATTGAFSCSFVWQE